MANTAADPLAQHERLRDALSLAEWSEDEFNNRNLFSDYFLKRRLTNERLFPQWKTDVRPAHRELAQLFQEAFRRRCSKRSSLRSALPQRPPVAETPRPTS
jgi:hypothetical protein